jgi:hypothetical protein
LHLLGRFPRERFEFVKRQIEPVCYLFEKRAHSGGALAVHLEIQPRPVGGEFDYLVVLPADVNDGNCARETMVAASGLATYLRYGLALVRDVAAAVAGGYHRRDVIRIKRGLLQCFIEAPLRGLGEIPARLSHGRAEDPGVIADDNGLCV